MGIFTVFRDRFSGNLKATALENLPEEAWTPEDISAIDELYQRTALLYAVENIRANQVVAIPRVILDASGQEIAEEDLPFKIDLSDLMYRWSLSMDQDGAGYALKETLLGSNMMASCRFVNPSTITEITEENLYELSPAGRLAATKGNNTLGVYAFKRELSFRRPMEYIVENDLSRIAWVWLPGLQETGPGQPPGVAGRLGARVLFGSEAVIDNFFASGAVDQWLLFGPQAMVQPQERERFKAWWKRVLMGGIKTAGEIQVLHPDSRIESMNTPIKDWVINDLRTAASEDVTLAHNTPLGILRPDLVTNKATLDRVRQDWVNDVVVPFAQLMVDALNRQVFGLIGLQLKLKPDEMFINQEEERQKAQAFTLYVGAGVNPDWAAAALGIDGPDDIPFMATVPTPMPPPAVNIVPEDEDREQENEFNVEKALTERSQFRRWYKKRQGNGAINLEDFSAHYISHRDKLQVVKSLLVESANGEY